MSTSYRSIARLEEIIDDQYLLLDEGLVAHKWAGLARACKPFFDISEHDIEAGRTEPCCINSLFDVCDGIRVIEPLKIMSAYTGDRHGGHTDLYVEQDTEKQPYLSALTFENSVVSMIEAFYVTFELPKKGCFWHGCYDRDYSLLRSVRWLVAALQRRSDISSDGDGQVKKVDRPPGIRLIKHSDSYRLTCLAAYPNGEVVDMSLTLNGGRIAAEPSEVVLPPCGLHFY